MMRFSEVRHRDVVAIDSAETIGRVEALLVDPESRTIAAIHVSKVGRGNADWISWDDLKAFGQDAVTIGSADLLRMEQGEREAGLKKISNVLGKRVLDDAGFAQGEVKDVEFDPKTGAITTIITARTQISGDRLRGVGSWAVVVTHEQD